MISWPLLGHLPAMARGPFAFLASLSRRGDLVRVDVGTLPVYAVTSPELIHQVLVTDARDYTKGRLFDRVRPLLGSGLVTADRETHQRQRRLMQPAFHRARMPGYAEVMRRRAAALAESWRAGQTVAVDKAMHELTLGAVTETMFSSEPSAAAIAEIHRSLPVISRNTAIRALAPKALDRLPIRAHRDFDTASRRLRAVLEEIIGYYHARGIDHGDLLSLLLSTPMSDVQVRDELITILLAGTETSAAALSWAFHHLGQHPESAARIREDPPYAERVLNEVMRLHSVPLVMRRALVPVRLAGQDLPVGTELVISPYALHRDPKWYSEPERFDPDREPPPAGAFLPFGDGARKCIGDTFARTEMTIVLTTVLRQWRLDPVPGHRVREVFAGVPHPRSLPMTVAQPL
ncbi:cytochrome P450 [Allokutzneria sp. NRRL B-24872]|uniref:cytochrome P450 n=1 Tax=Allokutzneria sp. NRRL B-24872 TaxID=1137961 RepID=UPI001AF001B0|nr:cytochrome P450 [Allokutzneria sp. NRRL B-24872]